jgi:hypothetical protein
MRGDPVDATRVRAALRVHEVKEPPGLVRRRAFDRAMTVYVTSNASLTRDAT